MRGAPAIATEPGSGVPFSLPRPFAALRAVFAEGYDLAKLRADVLAGLVVGIVALPPSMALAIATGLPPQHGLYTAIVAGAATALLGGSRVQVSGPTAAFVVVLLPIAAKHGPGGLMIATLLAGAMLLLMGLARLGRLIARAGRSSLATIAPPMPRPPRTPHGRATPISAAAACHLDGVVSANGRPAAERARDERRAVPVVAASDDR